MVTASWQALAYIMQAKCRASGLDAFIAEEQGEGQLQVAEAVEGQGSTIVTLRHVLESQCGSHILRIACTLWLYNCSGLPLAIQQAPEGDAADQEASSILRSAAEPVLLALTVTLSASCLLIVANCCLTVQFSYLAVLGY